MTRIEAVKSAVRIEEVIGRTVKLTRRNGEFHGLCPFHEEKTPSFTVFSGSRFQCFGCGEKGDVVDFVRKAQNCSLSEALEYLGGSRDNAVTSLPRRAIAPPTPYISAPPPPDAPAPPLPPDATAYPYRDAAGSIISYVVRTEATEDRKKTFRGLSWSAGGKWTWKHPSAPRPLYGLDGLAIRPDAPVLVCEGEKAADAAAGMFPDFVVTTWPGGSNAVGNADWSVLVGRDLTIWPDADEPGAKACRAILAMFTGAAWIDTTGLEDGFDAADLDVPDPHEWLHNRIRRAEIAPEFDHSAPPYEPEPEQDAVPDPIRVVPLGYSRDFFYYYSSAKRQVCELKAAAHTRAELCGMASAAKFWEVEYERFASKRGLSWAQIADSLISNCHERGVFDPGRIRGRGAWLEGTTPVLHVGDGLIVNGNKRGLTYPGSRYIYEADATLLHDIAPPLDSRDAHWLVKVCKLLRWEMPASGMLLAGWIALAPVCGALQWRPSVWLSGGSGSGKSWIMDNIVNVCLSQIALYVAFNTTEPGIRGALQSDARPVVFDEAERDSAAAAFRMDEILGYQRVASSENSVQILKGDTGGGRARSYKPRSCFLFQSINTGITKKSDESRVTVLSLRDHSQTGDVAFDDLEATAAERLTPEFAAGLISRSVSLLPVIRENARTFARAVAAHLQSRRFGDQLGTLLAGAYSLHSSEVVSYEKALEIVRREEWTEQTPEAQDKDEFRLLRTILAARVKIGTMEMPVARLVEASGMIQASNGLPDPELSQRILSEAGIKYGHHENVTGLFFSTNHPALKRLLRGTDWEASWSRSLGRIPGAISGRAIEARFGLGHRGRATFIPMSVIEPR